MRARKIYLAVCCIFWMSLPVAVTAQRYEPAKTGCKVEFKAVSHKDGQVVRGLLSDVRGKIIFDPKNAAAAMFDVSVGLGGITSGVSKIDGELKKASYLNALKYPVIKLKSTSVRADGAAGVVFVLNGNLTIKNITKPVHLQFTASHIGDGYVFRGRLAVSKQAFDIGTKEDGIDDEVSVYIEVRALQSKK